MKSDTPATKIEEVSGPNLTFSCNNRVNCICGGVETTEYFLLYCKNYEQIRHKHFDSLNINISTNLLLFGSKDMNDDFNEKLFITVQKYIIETKRFS